jgi:hypothetical protein
MRGRDRLRGSRRRVVRRQELAFATGFVVVKLRDVVVEVEVRETALPPAAGSEFGVYGNEPGAIVLTRRGVLAPGHLPDLFGEARCRRLLGALVASHFPEQIHSSAFPR